LRYENLNHSDAIGISSISYNYRVAAGKNKSAPGPTGHPSKIQITRIIDHTIKKITEKGNIKAITVPIPAFLSYLWTNATIRAK
jgi:hypothetical protein